MEVIHWKTIAHGRFAEENVLLFPTATRGIKQACMTLLVARMNELARR
jgi:hypothetical protein